MKKIILSMFILVFISSTVFAGWTDWEPKYEGIWYAEYSTLIPLVKGYAFRVDMENPNTDFAVTPSNGNTDGLQDGTVPTAKGMERFLKHEGRLKSTPRNCRNVYV